MATTVKMTKVTIPGDGRYIFTFADGTGMEFPSLQDVIDFTSAFDDPNDNGLDNARLMDIAYLQKRSPDFTQVNSVLNKDFILDLSSGSVVRVQ